MYKLVNRNNELIAILRIADNTSIPLVETNTDYQAFLKYQAEGGVVLPADEVTV